MTPPTTGDRTSLEARRAVLVQRLDDGDQRIADARLRGAETAKWEMFWLQLLDEYVELSERLESDVDDAMDVAA